MNRLGRIIILDDDPDWQNILTRALKARGFHVDSALSVDEARQFLKANNYHLAVFDVSMVEGDAKNREGMDFLAELHSQGRYPEMAVLMISAYGTKAMLREAMTRYKANDFHDKIEFDLPQFISQVEQLIAAKINLELDLQWESRQDREDVVLNMEIDGERVKRGTELQSRIVDELEDLLCRLFPDAISLLVRPMSRGTSGSTVLLAMPFFKEGAAQPVVVKVGSVSRTIKEESSFREHAQPFIRGRSTSVIRLRQTPHIGGLVYSLVGGSGDNIESFISFYYGADVTQINSTLTHLFRETCGGWYANPGHLQLCNLTDHYCQKLGLTEQNLRHSFAQLKGVQGKRQLYFDTLPDRSFTNPIDGAWERHFMESTYFCSTHGDLNGENILVDRSNHAWLIDFEHTGLGHILRDIAELDFSVRVQFLMAEHASLEERLVLEEALCQAKTFSDIPGMAREIQVENPQIQKSYATTLHLRTIAAELMSRNPNANLAEYYVALFYYALNSLRFLSWRGIQRQHALLSASLLADKLGL